MLQLLKQVLGAGVELAGWQIGNQQHDYLVLLLQLRHPSMKVVAKLAGPKASLAAAFERTAMLQRLVAAHTNIPMPEVLAVDTSCQAWPWRYLLMTHIEGQEWAAARGQMTGEELSDAYRQIGSAWGPYEAICPIAPLYKKRRAIYQLLWCLEYARFTAEHLEDTQRVCRELGLPRFEHNESTGGQDQGPGL